MEANLIGTPFFLKDCYVSRSVFTFAPTSVGLTSISLRQITGAATNLNRNLAGRAALGELVERYSITVKPPSIRSYSLTGFNLSSGETAELPLHEVYLAHPQTIFPPGEQKQYFNDSVGAASHVDSARAIESAWFEFIERQSFIYSWLTRTPGLKISSEAMGESSQLTIQRLSYFFDEIHVYDISLHKDVCVALVLGLGKTFMSIGTSAHWETSAAVHSALREFLSTVYAYTPFMKRNIMNYGSNEELNEQEQVNNVYWRNFYEGYTPERLREAFRYLEEGATLRSSNRKTQMSKGIGSIIPKIVDICRSLLVEPILVRVPASVHYSSARVVKMTSIGGYPHMRTDILVPEEHAISCHKGSVEFPNRGLLIPFP